MKKASKQHCSTNSMNYFMHIDSNTAGSINHPKNTRIIYTIDTKLTREEIEAVVSTCEIEFFSIDTTSFEKVNDYYEIIDIIKETCQKFEKNIGIIAELKGRKIKVDNLNLKNENRGVFHLKKGDLIKVSNSTGTLNSRKQRREGLLNLNENRITVKFKDIHKLVKKDDSIIINDNKGALKVLSVKESLPKPNSMAKLDPKLVNHHFADSQFDENNRDRKYSDTADMPYSNPKHSSMSDIHQGYNFPKVFSFTRTSVIQSKNDGTFASSRSTNMLKDLKDQGEYNSNSSQCLNIDTVPELQKTPTPTETYNHSEMTSEKDEFDNLYEEYDVMLTGEDEIKDEYRFTKIDQYLKATSKKFTVRIAADSDPVEEEESELSLSKQQGSIASNNISNCNSTSPVDDIVKRRKKLCSKIENKTYEILCQVEYDCKINKNSFLFVPNVDYAALDIDVLSPREVSEINDLDSKGIDFICISIKNMKDIESIRDINSNIKIIASIPDYTALEEIHDILTNTCGIVISRTFQILNRKTKYSINRLTSFLIAKCREHGTPIYSYLDINQGLFCKKKKKAQISEVMYNIIDGMDGFFLNINLLPDCAQGSNEDFNFTMDALKYFSGYFERIQNDKYFVKSEIKVKERESWVDFNSPYGVLLNLIKKYDCRLDNSFIAYLGEDITDVQNISKLKLSSPLVVFSSDKVFLNHSQLFYSVITVEEKEINNMSDCIKTISESLSKKFKNKTIILVRNDKNKRKILVKMIT